jgi:hypothetical protein
MPEAGVEGGADGGVEGVAVGGVEVGEVGAEFEVPAAGKLTSP